MGTVTTLLFAAQQWLSLEASLQVERDVQDLDGIIRLPEALNMERAYVSARLIAPTAATPEQLIPVNRQIDMVDAALSEAQRRATVPGETLALDHLGKTLVEVRTGVLRAIEQPPAERAAELTSNYLPRMFALQNETGGLAVAVQRRIDAQSTRIGLASLLAQLAWVMRDWCGRQTTTLIRFSGLALPMAGAQAEELAEFKGHIDQTWFAIQATAAEVNSPLVKAAIDGAVEGYWAHGGEAYATWVLPNRGQPISLEPDAFLLAIRPILDTILPIRDAALAEALRESRSEIAATKVRFELALCLVLLMACIGGATGLWFSRRVVRPTEELTVTILALASGASDVAVPLQSRTDEIGQMARAIEILRRNALQAAQRAQEILALQQGRAERGLKLETAAQTFEAGMADVLAGMTDATTQLSRSGVMLTSAAVEGNVQADAVAASASLTAENMRDANTSISQLMVSVSAVNAQATSAAHIAIDAAAAIQKTNASVQELTVAASSIDNIVDIIARIADQTKLLALNATIEAANAGEHGRSFTVVANEVKTLAVETSHAAQTISRHISNMRNATTSAMAEVGNIRHTIYSLEDVSASVASASREQSRAIQDMIDLMHHATEAAAAALQQAEQVRRSAQKTHDTADAVRTATETIRERGDAMQTGMAHFIASLRKA